MGDASWPTYGGGGTLLVAACTPSTLSSVNEELGKFVGVDVS